ncbi:MAG: tail fiber domain-containing protein, partial [Saonia sp.]
KLNGNGTGGSNIVRFRLMESNGSTEQAKLAMEGSNNLFLQNTVTFQSLQLLGGGGVNGFRFYDGTTSQTVWHRGNDGSGSGLDADLWDGLQRPDNLGSNAYGGLSYDTVDLNAILDIGQSVFYRPESTNKPDSNGGYQFTFGGGDVTNRGAQIAATRGSNNLWFRVLDDKIWRKIWTNKTTQLLEGTSGSLKVQSPTGYIDIGSKNTSHCHFYTDRSNFYFNKELRVDTGKIGSYNEDLILARAGSSQDRLRITTGYCISDQDFLIYGRGAQPLSIRGSSNNANTPCYARFEKQDGSDRGYIGYGSSSNSHLYLYNNEGTDCYLMLKTNGEAEFNNNVRADNFILSSDERLKENIMPLKTKSLNTNWVSFDMKGEQRFGVIAQELEKSHPELVRTDEEGYKSVAYVDLLVAKNAELEARIEKLEKLIEKLV